MDKNYIKTMSSKSNGTTPPPRQQKKKKKKIWEWGWKVDHGFKTQLVHV